MRRMPYSKLNVESKLKSLATVVYACPGGDLDAWHNIAKCMNRYLHDEGIWKSEDENFPAGKDCLDFLRQICNRLYQNIPILLILSSETLLLKQSTCASLANAVQVSTCNC